MEPAGCDAKTRRTRLRVWDGRVLRFSSLFLGGELSPVFYFVGAYDTMRKTRPKGKKLANPTYRSRMKNGQGVYVFISLNYPTVLRVFCTPPTFHTVA